MSAAPPEGTVTFLFTDLVGSTQLWETKPEAMRAAVASHDEILRGLFDHHGGYVFTTAGDSFAVAFPVAARAMEAAIAVQHEMGSTVFDEVGELRVRIGLHTGTAELRNADYFGPDVNLAARIMSAAHAGQVILSAAAAELAPTIETIDLGAHHFKGIRQARQIRQIVADGLVADFPPLRTDSAPTTNLPEARRTLLGREAGVARVTKLLDDHRLVSLVGPGGVGKTSLAIEVATGLAPREGTWFVDLGPVASDEHLPIAFADAIGLSESGSRALSDQITSHLRDREAVLVVDNCEHVIDGAAAMMEDLLAYAPSVRLLATSREVLELPGEAVFTVGPLDIPDADAELVDLRRSPALQLLDECANAANPELNLLDTDLAVASEVCRLVDGLPLAIELAGARLRVMSVAELAEHLHERFSVLAAGRGRQERHRTLEAVIDWSYGLLDESEQRAFEHLAVFSGGFTATAAETVLPASLGRIEMLAKLVDKSLVVTEMTDGGTRYGMLETLRGFASQRLDESDSPHAPLDAHLAWTLALIDTLETDMRTPRQDASLRAARPEHDNLRAARAWAEERDPIATLRITASAPIDTHIDRQRRLGEQLASAEGASADLLARARYTALGAAFEGGDFESGIEHGRAAIALFAELGDAGQLAYSEMLLSFCLWSVGESDEIARLLESSLRSFDTLEDPMGRAYLNWTLSQWKLHVGSDILEARAQGAHALDLFVQIDSPYGVAHATEGVGHLLVASGEPDDALSHMRAAFDQLHEMGLTGCMAHAVDGVAFVLVQSGDHEGGAELVGAAERLRHDSGAARRPWEIDATERCLVDLREGLPAPDLEAALARGRAMTVSDIRERVESVDLI